MKEKLRKILKRNQIIYNLTANTYNFLIQCATVIFGYIFRCKKIINNKIVVCNYYGKGYGDSAKYICDYLINHYEDIDIVWMLNKENYLKNTIPKKIRIVKYGSISSLYELSTAKIWIDNCRKEYFQPKRKKQKYIQLWHGGLGIKKIEQQAIEKLSKQYIKKAKKDSKMIDIAISNSSYRTQIYKESFWYNGKILEYGCARNDIFFNNKLKENIKNKVFKELNIDKYSKIILYVPTFRDDDNFDYYSFNIEQLVEQLEKKYNNKYLFIIKMHYKVKKRYESKNKNIIDATDYPDVYELLLIADILISDYSSIFFDFSLMSKPIYLYAPDYNSYINERGLNFEYKTLPFSISYNSNELINNILNEDFKNYQDRLKEFIKKMKVVDDGQSSKRIANLIKEIIREEENEKKV